MIRSVLITAAAIVGISGGAAMSATYDAFSFVQTKAGKSSHSVGFGKRVGVNTNRLRGAGDKKFFFEAASGGSLGTFQVDGDTATLTGVLRNRSGEAFEVSINFSRTVDPRAYKAKKGVSRDDWSYFSMESGTLTSLTEGLASFDLRQRGSKRTAKGRKKLAVQMGTGANVSNEDVMGLFTKFRASEQDCEGGPSKCQRFNGSLKLILEETFYDPDDVRAVASSVGEPTGASIVPVPASLMLLPAALGALGIAGGFGRRRRKS